jgi:hypothetical protein
MGWLDPFGPLVMIFGSCCGAVALESRYDVEPWNGRVAREIEAESTDVRAGEDLGRVA